MIKRLVLVAAVATTLGSAIGVASAADPSICITSDVNVNGTALPTNGTTCLPPAAP